MVSQEAAESKLSFEEAALRSGLITQRKYERVCELAKTKDPEIIAATLVKSGVMTHYQAAQLKAGRTKLTLGPYLITDWIGQGGMGQVFKAVHKVMGRVCAVKVLPLEKSTPQSRDSFMREIRVQAELDHPSVVRAYDAGVDGSVHYLVTEFVPGTDLRRLVRNQGPLSQSETASIIAQVARGLQYAHQIGLVHRDIKPGNILVTNEGVAKLSDIGLATWAHSMDADPRAGKIVGTADYLSPEQIQNPRGVGPASDIYSLGCTTYYAVTGKVPFPGGDARSKCRRHCEQTPWHPRKFAPELSEDFVDTIADMMEKDVNRRISTAIEVAERMEPFASGVETITPPFERQAWMPPPPPHEPVPRELAEVAGAGASDSESVPAMMPVSLDPEMPPAVRGSRRWTTIAWTIAIVSPFMVVAGFLIGYAAASGMFGK
jgi:eukaryotic-like serine/threonine-protein kinase